MQQQQESTTSAIAGTGGGVDGKRSLPKGAHVRFSHVEVDGAAQDTGKKFKNKTENPSVSAARKDYKNGKVQKRASPPKEHQRKHFKKPLKI